MAEQNRPVSPAKAPDPSHSYERSHPSRESDKGSLAGEKAVPQETSDKSKHSPNEQDPTRQVNAQDVVNQPDEPRREKP